MPRLSLARVPTGVLKKELSRRLEALPKLMAQRDELNCQIAELEALAGAEETPKPTKVPAPRRRGRRAKRAKSPMSLARTLAEVIKTKDSMSIAEATKGVLATGYTSKSKDFPNLVSMTLANDKRFERVARGVYRLRG
jgi:hypothetical protein